MISGEGESFSRDRIWIALAMDGELATAPPPTLLAAAGAGYPVRLATGPQAGAHAISIARARKRPSVATP